MDSLVKTALERGVNKIFPDKKGLSDLMLKRKIRIYQGFDPSMPSLHLGNLAGVMKLRQFQKTGHEVIFLIGDFTGMIGDPTDKLATRKQLTREDVLQNSRNWKKQIENIIDFDGKNPAKILFNSSWLDKTTFKDLIEITSKFTVQQMIERDMFQERIKKEKPIHLHEFLYPVAQGYDSVAMDVDLEIGGNDQLFNMMAGRSLMKAVKNKEKYVLTTKLLVDKEGKKVGKTTGNALFLDSNPEEFFAGVMSFPDETIYLGFELLTEVKLGTSLEESIKKDPMAEKKRLAFEVVNLVWGKDEAKKSLKSFEKTFQEKQPEYNKLIANKNNLLELLAGEVGSKSEAKRLLSQNAISLNDKKVSDPSIKLNSGDKLKIGKRTFVTVK